MGRVHFRRTDGPVVRVHVDRDHVPVVVLQAARGRHAPTRRRAYSERRLTDLQDTQSTQIVRPEAAKRGATVSDVLVATGIVMTAGVHTNMRDALRAVLAGAVMPVIAAFALCAAPGSAAAQQAERSGKEVVDAVC